MRWDPNVGNRMQVVVQGKTYEFYLDGVLISEPVTMDHLPLGGYFGLFSRGPAIFRDIRLNTFSKSAVGFFDRIWRTSLVDCIPDMLFLLPVPND